MNKLLLFFVFTALSCGNSINKSPELAKVNNKEEKEIIQKDMLLGEFTKEDLQQAPFSSWYHPNYDNYTPEPEALSTIADNINDYDIKVLMGTWCGDSKREVPKLLKLLDKVNYNYENLDLVAVDRSKTTPSKIEQELDVHHVPTIIFYKNGKEINRFVEYSQGESIEEDIARIVSGREYKNSYAD